MPVAVRKSLRNLLKVNQHRYGRHALQMEHQPRTPELLHRRHVQGVDLSVMPFVQSGQVRAVGAVSTSAFLTFRICRRSRSRASTLSMTSGTDWSRPWYRDAGIPDQINADIRKGHGQRRCTGAASQTWFLPKDPSRSEFGSAL